MAGEDGIDGVVPVAEGAGHDEAKQAQEQAGDERAETNANLGTRKAGWSPNMARLTMVPLTDPTTNGANVVRAALPRTTSIVKKTAAMGALNDAAMAEAVPAPTSVCSVTRPTPMRRPMTDPTVAPSATAGPSRPAEPPVPSVIHDARVLTTPFFRGMRPPCSEVSSMISGVASPLSPKRRSDEAGWPTG